MKNHLPLVVLFLFIRCSTSTPSHQLQLVFDEYEQFQAYDKKEFPLGDFSKERFERETIFWEETQQKLAIIPAEDLSTEEQTSLKMLQFILKNNLMDFAFQTHLNPILSDAGFHNDLVYKVQPLSTREEVVDYISLLEAIPLFVSQQITLIQQGIDV